MTVIIIAVILVFIFIAIRSHSTGKAAPRGKCYADVFVYNGEFRWATYVCDSSYHEKQIVVVNYKGQNFAGRILRMYYERPDVPRNVVFKEILRPFTKSDITSVAQWNDSIEKAIMGEVQN